MTNSEGFTLSPFRIVWADNNWPNTVCLAGPQAAAMLLPSGWVETIGYCCGPDRSRNGGEASASVTLLKAVGGEVVLHPSGWTDGNCMPRGWPLGPDTSVRMGNGQPKTALIVMSMNRMRRHGYPVFSPLRLANNGVRWHTLVSKLQMHAEIREKDRIRRLRPCQYLTRAGKVAILGTDFGNPAVQMATLRVDLANLNIILATLAPSIGNPESRLANPRFR